jgi:dUTP pyrophosphatase
MPPISVDIVNQSSNELPAYATPGAAGMDVRANLESPVSLRPLERKLIPTGLSVSIPEGFEIQVRPRSGLAVKQGITCLNTPGTIDSDYRGEIKVLLINLGETEQVIMPGDRIAQLVLAPVAQVRWQEVTVLDETNRGARGFGHTGVR